jgi:hypothetical protein
MKTHKSTIERVDPETTPMYSVTITETGNVYLIMRQFRSNQMTTTLITREGWAETTEGGFGVGLAATTESGFLLLQLVDVALELSDMLKGVAHE